MRNKKAVAIVGLAAMMLVGGTLAYYQQELEVQNPFDTGKYDSVLVEDFKPEDGDNWEPGATVDKKVEVKNTGDYDLLVRVKFDETWVNKQDASWSKTNSGLNATTIEQENNKDGLIANDKSVVKKTLNDANWFYNDADGYWYYKNNLESAATTGEFLQAVQLLEDVDMGKYVKKNYYTKAETKPAETEIGTNAESQWVAYTGVVPNGAKHSMAVTELDSTARGYANANYTLTITAETVQATEAAMKNTFGLASTPSGCTWNLTQDK